MKLPGFGKKIVGSWIEGTDWLTSDGNLEGIDLEHTLVLSYSDQSYKTITVRSWFSNETIEEMAISLGLIQPAKPVVHRARRKLCKNGHQKDAENTILVSNRPVCRTCYLASLEKQKAERAAANGGQK